MSMECEEKVMEILPTTVMLEAYSAWLHFERQCLNASFLPPTQHGRPSMAVPTDNDGANFHDRAIEAHGALNDPEAQRQAGLEAQRRAALVLSMVGCGWNGKRVFVPLPEE
ncbi:hypothetical protein AFCDBAGC_2735 [Methylobacterium cerastii]|uniref:Uncharacterized protein n=1 Tax=Methylobacterium cerastii TaxID=932741 RepID=A0ABQ4QHX1_9HYPH|nr:hypothetical protein [Methylobacterium cerastii]GJD44866.1 hypothetical protein AFCDBAGC_2735 [Methylobacterium cerastii]